MANGHTNERRSGILAAAQRVFEAHGYAATTMEAVAVESGISKGSIYNYFNSKQELFYQLLTDAVAAGQADSQAVLERDIPAQAKIDLMLDQWYQQLGYHLRISRLVLEYWATAAREHQGQLADSFKQMYRYWREQFCQIISKGIDGGEFSGDYDLTVAASLILAMLDGIMVQSMLDIGINVNPQFLDGLKRAIRVALSAKDDKISHAVCGNRGSNHGKQ
ncbi:MAG: TetR/AcrR family transcriptional regulator [Phycisphaerae bacterium]